MLGGLCFPVFYYFFFLHLIRVPTGAMENTILRGDYLVVKKRAFGEIKRGDLIVFRYPRDISQRYLFRVVGLPSERIEIRGRSVFINGQKLNEQRVIVEPDPSFDSDSLQELSTEGSGPYRVYYFSRETGDESALGRGNQDYPFGGNRPYQIPENEYFVMGDNRDNSEDSRFWGTVPRDLVFGKPNMIYWSVRHDTATGTGSIRWNRVFSKIS